MEMQNTMGSSLGFLIEFRASVKTRCGVLEDNEDAYLLFLFMVSLLYIWTRQNFGH